MEKRIAARKRARTERLTQYSNLKWIAPTSNIVERFFSQVKRVFTDCRQSLTPENLEAIMFLRVNDDLWGEKKIHAVLNK